LNIENHCSYEQQGAMARILKEIFKGKIQFILYLDSSLSFVIDQLLLKPLVDEFDKLPSPEELKYKVLLRVIIIIII